MKSWRKLKIGDLLSRVKDDVQVDDFTTYSRITIRMAGKGVALRDRVVGSEIGTKRQFIARSGQFVLSKIDARNGAFGVLPEECDNAIVTGNFWVFDVDHNQLDSSYFNYLSKSPEFVAACVAASDGTTNRRYLQEDAFLRMAVPVPELTEQQAVVTRLDALAEKTRDVEANLDAVERDSLRLLVTLATRRDLTDEKRRALGWRPGTIADIAALALDPAPVATDRSYPNVGILSYARGVFGKAPIDGAATSAKTLYRIRSGQFIYSRLFAFEGAYALVPDEFDCCFVSNEFPTFDVDSDLASSKYLMALFMTEADWHEMRASTKGVGDRRLRIQPEHVLARPIWIPPSHEIHRIDSLFDHHIELMAKHAAIRQANAALLPATLERLFGGSV